SAAGGAAPAAGGGDEDNPLPHHVDPVTLEPVVAPAISPYGHVMGLATWRAVLSDGRRCPFTKRPLRPEQLVVLTRANVERYRDVIVRRWWVAERSDGCRAGGGPIQTCVSEEAGYRRWERALGDASEDAFVTAALSEAVELARHAQRLAQQQARAELQQGWIAGGAADAEAGTCADERPEALLSFLQEQGLSSRQAEQVLSALMPGPLDCSDTSGGAGKAQRPQGRLSRGRLEAQWASLQRVLAGGDVVAMVACEPRLLQAASGDLVGALVHLVAAFPGIDAADIVQRRPGLLLLDDLSARCERAVSKLMQLHPSGDRGIVSALIKENPSLIVRMDYYQDARTLDDLPIEIQNVSAGVHTSPWSHALAGAVPTCPPKHAPATAAAPVFAAQWMVPGGQAGIGWLYRYWAQKKQ
ncbi:hypothetical protein MNEG_10152, partial [Monoraphidium neglectum]